MQPAECRRPAGRSGALTKAQKARNELLTKREELRIGIPRVLNSTRSTRSSRRYFESLGIPPQNLVYSDYTTEELYKAGAKRGAIDPCFPSKIGIPHVHNLLYGSTRRSRSTSSSSRWSTRCRRP